MINRPQTLKNRKEPAMIRKKILNPSRVRRIDPRGRC
jgi:hypothetical protein